MRSLACDLSRLVNDRKLSDITFIVEGKEVFGHKNILCARCDRFQAMLFSGCFYPFVCVFFQNQNLNNEFQE